MKRTQNNPPSSSGSRYRLYKSRGQNKSSRLAGLFSHLLRYGKSFIALLCASFRFSNTPHRKSPWGMTENPAQYGMIYSGRGPNATAESETPPLLSKSSTTALVFLILLLISPPLHARPLESFLIFYSNNIQGELEPCG